MNVAEYCRGFFEKYLRHDFGETPEDNFKTAGQNFVTIIRKLQDTGSKDDLKVPLRVLRDEIGRAYFASEAAERAARLEALFCLYDALEAACQAVLRGGRPRDKDKEAAAAQQVLDELRQRFARLTVGETWEAFPELKLRALKRMYQYAEKEVQLRQAEEVATPTSTSTPKKSPDFGLRQRLSRAMSMSAAATGTWEVAGRQAALADLAKAPGAKLVPLLRLLLAENARCMGASVDLGDAPPPQGGLLHQASDASELAGRASRSVDFSLDDLLGLAQPHPEPAAPPATPPLPGGPSAQGEDAASPAPSQTPLAGLNGEISPALSSPPVGPQPEAQPGANQNGRVEAPATPTTSNPPAPSPPASSFNSFESNAFGDSVFPQKPPQATALPKTGSEPPSASSVPGIGTLKSGQPQPIHRQNSNGSAFNPFGLPSPTFASPVPPTADNRFSEFSPIAAAPPPPVPQPMRAPPPPPGPPPSAKSAW